MEWGPERLSLDDQDQLAQILYLVNDEWHLWEFPDSSGEMFTEYLSAHANHRELIDKSIVAASYVRDEDTTLLTIMPKASEAGPNLSLNLENSRKYLAQPLRLFVENGINDALFVEAVVRAIDPDLAKIVKSSPTGRLVVTHGGGKAELVRQLGPYGAQMDSAGYPARVLVVVDSDSRYSGHDGADTAKVRTECSGHGFSLHVLWKRAIENYFSNRILNDYANFAPDVQAAVTMISNLSEDQRDYYPIKKGIASVVVGGPEAVLYANIPAHARSAALPRVAAFWLDKVGHFYDSDIDARNFRDEAIELAATLKRCL